MILYFSATGNTEFIAKELAKRLNDECLNLLDRIKSRDYTPIHSEKPFIVCAPVYVCEIPRFMAKYLKKVSLTGSRDIYCIFTSGGYCGPSGILTKHLFKRKGMRYMGYGEFQMPRNYVVNNSYPMLSQEDAQKRILESYNRIDEIVTDISNGNDPKTRKVSLFETIITVPFNPLWCKYMLKAKDFFSKESCIGCGKCEKLCPLNNISLKDKKPVWGKECTHCMACISNCPVRAIEYGNITQCKEPYNFKNHSDIIK